MSRIKAMLSDPTLTDEEREIVQRIVDGAEKMIREHDEKIKQMKLDRKWWKA